MENNRIPLYKITVGLCYIFFIIAYCFVHFDIEKYIYGKISPASDYLFNLFTEHPCLLWLACVFVIVIVCSYFIYRRKNRYWSTNVCWLLVFTTEFLFLTTQSWDAPILFSNFNFLQFCAWGSAIILIIYSFQLCYYSTFNSEVQESQENIGFTTDESNQFDRDLVREQYAKEIVARLLKIPNQKKSDYSFAMAIYGSWGSGKTTFLESLKEELEQKKQILFDFNPWKCTSPQLIISAFFQQLASKLSPYHSNLSSPLMKYANLLNSVDTMGIFQPLIDKIFPEANDLENLKGIIHNALSDVDKKIYIIVDDIDRLDKEELFEVLRLIRNTANFPNLIFIAAMDKSYVISQLKAKDIDAGYLEKIFLVDFNLPNVLEDAPFSNLFLKDIKYMIENDEVYQKIISHFNPSFSLKFNRFLGSYRSAKRFARLFSTDYMFIFNNKAKSLVEIEFLWLELLKHVDIMSYERLLKTPNYYLDVKHSDINVGMYVLKDPLPRDCNIEVTSILRHLFYLNDSPGSINYLVNFDKYFSLGFSFKDISATEFLDLISTNKSNSDLQNYVESCVENNRINSLLFKIHSTQFVDNNQIKSFVILVLHLLPHVQQAELQKLADICFSENMYQVSDSDTFCYFLKNILHTYIIQVCTDFTPFVKAFTYMISQISRGKSYVLSVKDLYSIIHSYFHVFLSNNQFDASDVLVEGNPLRKILEASVYYDEDYGYSTETEYKCILFHHFLKYFKKRKSMNIEKVRKFGQIPINPLSPSEDKIKDLIEKKSEEIKSIFGSEKNYLQYRDECFEQ